MPQFPLTVDEVVQNHPEIASVAALRAVVTVGMQWPVVWMSPVSGVADNTESWKLRARVGGENDDGVSLIVPNDWNGTTNNVIWVRIA